MLPRMALAVFLLLIGACADFVPHTSPENAVSNETTSKIGPQGPSLDTVKMVSHTAAKLERTIKDTSQSISETTKSIKDVLDENAEKLGKTIQKTSKSISETTKSIGDTLDEKSLNSTTPIKVTSDDDAIPTPHQEDGDSSTKHMKRRATLEDYLPTVGATLVFAATCVLSFFCAKLFPYFGLPLVSGYLFFGILLGPNVLGLITNNAIRSLRFVDEVALSFIAFAAGAQLDFQKLGDRKKAIKLTTIALVFTTFLFGTITLYSLRESVSFMQGMKPVQCWAIAMLGGTLMVARSPASALAIKKELRAEGPFTSTVMGTTIIMDVVVISLFAFVSLLANGMLHSSDPDPIMLFIFSGQMVISTLCGLFFGKIVLPSIIVDETSLYGDGHVGAALAEKTPAFAKALFRAGSYSLTLFLGFSIFFASHALEPYIEPLVTCMVAGCVCTNYTSSKEAFSRFEDEVSPLVNAAFFTLTGAALSLSVIIGPAIVLVLVLFLVRLFSIGIGAYVAGRAVGEDRTLAGLSWMAYITQAGVALGLAKKIHVEYHTWGGEFATAMIAVVIINQLIGPPFFRFIIRYAGEVGVKSLDHESAEAHPLNKEEEKEETVPVASASPYGQDLNASVCKIRRAIASEA